MQFQITGEQAESLRELLQDHCNGEPVLLTKQGVGETIVVAFSLATFEVSGGGTVDEL